MPIGAPRRLCLKTPELASRLAEWPLIQLTGHSGIAAGNLSLTLHLRGLYVAPAAKSERRSTCSNLNLSLGTEPRPAVAVLTPVSIPTSDDAIGSALAISGCVRGAKTTDHSQ